MHYPIVKFKLNKNLDKQTALNFLAFSAGGVNFGEVILKNHPKIKNCILKYVDEFYRKNKMVLSQKAHKFEKEWSTRTPAFFETANSVFRNYPWPKGKYIGYVSIFNCNPRFLDDKTFQIFYRHSVGSTYVTAHELLHFIFYDFLFKERKDLTKRFTDDEMWSLSEIVNEVLLNLPLFRKSLKLHPIPKGYPQFKKIVSKVSKRVPSRPTIDKVIDTILKLHVKLWPKRY